MILLILLKSNPVRWNSDSIFRHDMDYELMMSFDKELELLFLSKNQAPPQKKIIINFTQTKPCLQINPIRYITMKT